MYGTPFIIDDPLEEIMDSLTKCAQTSMDSIAAKFRSFPIMRLALILGSLLNIRHQSRPDLNSRHSRGQKGINMAPLGIDWTAAFLIYKTSDIGIA